MQYLIVMALVALPGGLSAAEDNAVNDGAGVVQGVELEQDEVYIFPRIEPEIMLQGGYRFIGLRGSARAGEYEYLHNSLLFGGEVRTLFFPHRFHLDIDIRNRKDFEGDLSYAYRDRIIFRGMSRALFHNLENIELIDPDPAPPLMNYGVMREDTGSEYGVSVRLDTLSLRLKPIEFPAHLFIEGRLVTRDGMMQQRFLGGAAYYIQPSYERGITRVSRKRDIDWETREYKVGANSHLGPIEVEYFHTEKRFSAGGDRFFGDAYSASGDGVFYGSVLRSAGVYSHNLVPDLRGSTDTLKFHTTYTGGLVAAATLSKTSRENRISRAKADYFIGAGDLTWIMNPKTAFFLKFKHKEADIDNASAETFGNSCSSGNNSTNTYACDILRPLSSLTNTISGTVRYRPISGVVLRAGYTFESISRENADVWSVNGSRQKDMVFISADARPVKGLTLKAKYTHYEIDHPLNNIEPNRSDEGKVSLSWIPVPEISTLLSYSILKDKRDDLQFHDTDQGDDRRTKRDRLFGSVAFVLPGNLSVTANYASMHHSVRQDITYSGTFPDPPLVDALVPYTGRVNSYGIGMAYMPEKKISLNADIQQTSSRGAFYPSLPDLLLPVSVASFSEFRIRESVFTAGGQYRIGDNVTLGLQYRYSSVNDLLNIPESDVRDGRSHIFYVTVAKKW